MAVKFPRSLALANSNADTSDKLVAVVYKFKHADGEGEATQYG